MLVLSPWMNHRNRLCFEDGASKREGGLGDEDPALRHPQPKGCTPAALFKPAAFGCFEASLCVLMASATSFGSVAAPHFRSNPGESD